MSKELICKAIATRNIMSFLYKGALRTVEPHILGYDNKGNLTLSAWQLSGGSGQSWRDYHTSMISGAVIAADHFSGPRPGYNPGDTTLSQIICRL